MSSTGETNYGTGVLNFESDPPFDFPEPWQPPAGNSPPQVNEEGQHVGNPAEGLDNRTGLEPRTQEGEWGTGHGSGTSRDRGGAPLNLTSQMTREGPLETLVTLPTTNMQMITWRVDDTDRQKPGIEVPLPLETNYFGGDPGSLRSRHRVESAERQVQQNDTDVKINFELGAGQIANFKAFLPTTIAISVDRIHPYCRSLVLDGYGATLREVVAHYRRSWRLNLAQKAGLHIAAGVAEAFISSNRSSLTVKAWDRLHIPIDPRIADIGSEAFHEGVREILRDYDAAIRVASFLTGATVARSFMNTYRDMQGLQRLTLEQQFIRPERPPQQDTDVNILGQAVLRCLMITKGSIDFLNQQPKNKGYHNEPHLRGDSYPFVTVYNQ